MWFCEPAELQFAQSRSSGGWSSLGLSRESSLSSSVRSRSGFSSLESGSLSRPLSGAVTEEGHCFECSDVIDTRVMLVDSFKACPSRSVAPYDLPNSGAAIS